jgi:hypothetical protein
MVTKADNDRIEQKKRVVAARIREIAPFRRLCINRKVDDGLELPVKSVQQRLGHSSVQMTRDGHFVPRAVMTPTNSPLRLPFCRPCCAHHRQEDDAATSGRGCASPLIECRNNAALDSISPEPAANQPTE